MKCKRCQQQNESGFGVDRPRCAFESGMFNTDNWNCATANAIRSICYEGQTLPPGVDYQFMDDEKYATIRLQDDDALPDAYCLWVQWYKNRGRTTQMVLLGDTGARYPTAEECEAVLAMYGMRSI